jgi:hypothetical protein
MLRQIDHVAPAAGEPAGRDELGAFHRQRHPDHRGRCAGEQHHHALDRKEGCGAREGGNGEVGRHVGSERRGYGG